ncbi:MAG: hypothetical protein VYB54_14675 [Pseudomonadota bacterium]|nr:hypothetical protein [Pseudomonadota bacterium]
MTALSGSWAAWRIGLNADVGYFLAFADVLLRPAGGPIYDINIPTNLVFPLVARLVDGPGGLYPADILQIILYLFVLFCSAVTFALFRNIPAGRHFVLVAAAFVIPFALIVLPRWHFGQREHLFVAAVAPLLVVLWLRHAFGFRPSRLLSIGIAVLAALAAFQKPHFIIVAGGIGLVHLLLLRGRLLAVSREIWLVGGLLATGLMIHFAVDSHYYLRLVPDLSVVYGELYISRSNVSGRLLSNGHIVSWLSVFTFLALGHLVRAPGTEGVRLDIMLAWLAVIFLFAGLLILQLGLHYHRLPYDIAVFVSAGLAAGWAVDRISTRLLHGKPGTTAALAAATGVLLATTIPAAIVLKPDAVAENVRQARLASPVTWTFQQLEPGTSVYALTTSLVLYSPYFAYSEVQWTGRINDFFHFKAIVEGRRAAADGGPAPDPAVRRAEDDLRSFVLASLSGPVPDLVLVDRRVPMTWLEDFPEPFSLTDFYLEDPAFAANWANYRSVGWTALEPGGRLDIEIFRREVR